MDVPALTPVAAPNPVATHEQTSNQRRFRQRYGSNSGQEADREDQPEPDEDEHGSDEKRTERAAVLYHQHIPRFILRLQEKCRSR